MFQRLLDQIIVDITYILNNKTLYDNESDFEWECNRLGHTISIIYLNGKLYKISPYTPDETLVAIFSNIRDGNIPLYIFNMTFKEDTIFGDLFTYFTNNNFSEQDTFRIIYNYDDILNTITNFTKESILERICCIYAN
jgi:hypothetical protein